MIALLSARTWESKAALLAHLHSCEPRTLLIGTSAEAPRTYESFSVSGDGGRCEIGVISSGLAPRRAAAFMGSHGRVLIGHDTSVTWIDARSCEVVTSLRLDYVFYDFLPVDRDDQIVVLHELGALRVDAGGAMKWSVDAGDIVEDSNVDGDGNLILRLMEGRRLVVSLASGTVSSGEPL